LQAARLLMSAPAAQHAWGPTDAPLDAPRQRGDAAPQPRRSRDRGARHEERAASLEAQLAGASLRDDTAHSRLRPPGGAAAPALDIEALVQPLVDEVERLQVCARSAFRAPASRLNRSHLRAFARRKC
jgi:hypothetical protein